MVCSQDSTSGRNFDHFLPLLQARALLDLAHHTVHVAVAIAGNGLLVPEVRTVWLGVIWGRESEEMCVLCHKFDYSIRAARSFVEMVLGSMGESLATAAVDCKSRRSVGGLGMVFVGAGIENCQGLDFAGCS
jgi:hypothetical protein